MKRAVGGEGRERRRRCALALFLSKRGATLSSHPLSMPSESPHAVLGIQPGASLEEVRNPPPHPHPPSVLTRSSGKRLLGKTRSLTPIHSCLNNNNNNNVKGEAGVPGQVPEAPPGRQRECLSRGLRPRHERVQLPHGREPAQPVPVDDLARRVRPRAAAKAEVQPRTRGSDHRPAARAGRHQGRPRLRQSSALYAPRERVARACGEPFFEPRGGEEAPGDEEEGCKAEGVIGWRGRWPLVAGLDLS